MAFSRTPLISFLLISLLFASSMAQSSALAGSNIFASFRFQNSTSSYAVSFEDYTGGCSFSSVVVTCLPSPLTSDFFSRLRVTSPSSIAFPAVSTPTPARISRFLTVASWIFGAWLVHAAFDF
ncbi:hypothetical protein Pint_09808 [Pistacia integerrima]|uniref:Uncharacterized protein n=1 Tax=Pistacia integerrima TaxID=434235 RepID=A0ACC0XH60_9ROSI|nr:hypothetical protein Pint_09808 [Pistacia integerrima]